MDQQRVASLMNLVAHIIVFMVLGTEGESSVSISYLTRITVSEASLSAVSRTRQSECTSLVLCATKAKLNAWSDVMCYRNEICQLYELTLYAAHTDLTADATDQCYTKLGEAPSTTTTTTTSTTTTSTTTRPPATCIVKSGTLLEGETEIEAPDCYKQICTPSGMLNVYGGVLSCVKDSLYSYVPSLGCLDVKGTSYVQYQNAEAECASSDGTLIVPSNFEAFAEWWACKSEKSSVWLGIVNTKWTNGTEVLSHVFADGEPRITDGCGYLDLEEASGKFKVYTHDCDENHRILCYRPN